MENTEAEMTEKDGKNPNREEVEVDSLINLPSLILHGRDFIPQTLACLAAASIVIHAGAQLAFSAVLLPELMGPNSAFTISEDEASWIASMIPISTPVGSLLSGPLMDRFGRKAICKITCLPIFLSWIIIAFANNVFGLYSGRLLAGFASGLASAALVYISEVSHQRWRPTLLCIISIFVSLGILMVCILCLWLDYKQMAILFSVMALVSFIMTCPLPETPHWLLRFQSKQKASIALRWLYKRELCYGHQLRALLDSYQPASTTSSNQSAFVKYFSEYKKLSTLKPIGILMVIFIFQQISGAYVVIFYAVNILQLVGGKYGSSISEYTAFAMMGIIRFVMSIVTAFASRRCGRRPVSIISGLGMAASALIAAICISSSGNTGDLFQTDAIPREAVQPYHNNTPSYNSYQDAWSDLIANNTSGNSSLIGENSATRELTGGVLNSSIAFNVTLNGTTIPFSEGTENNDDQWLALVCVILYVFFSSIGVLVIPWTLIGELSPVKVRGSCGGFITAFSSIMMFAVVKAFPYLLHIVKGQGIFYVFSATSFLGAVFVFVFLPETQGKTYEEIGNYFK